MTREEKLNQEGEIIRIFVKCFQKNKLDRNNEKLEDAFRMAIERIFSLEMDEIGVKYDMRNKTQNEIIERIIDDSKKKRRGMHVPKFQRSFYKYVISEHKPLIEYNIHYIFSGMESEYPEIRAFACKAMFKTIFHEITHYKQHLLVDSNISNNQVLAFARDFAIKRYSGKDFKKLNYRNLAIEASANEMGYKQYLDAIGERDEDIENLREIELRNISCGRI